MKFLVKTKKKCMLSITANQPVSYSRVHKSTIESSPGSKNKNAVAAGGGGVTNDFQDSQRAQIPGDSDLWGFRSLIQLKF